MIFVIADDVPGAAAAPAVEGLRAGRRHPPHGASFSLVVGVYTRPLSLKRRALKIPLLLLLILIDPCPPPMLMLSRLSLRDGEDEGRVHQVQHGGSGGTKRTPPYPSYPPPPSSSSYNLY